jgi:hypothetical protein
MSQNSQSFSCCLSHASLELPPRGGGLDYLANAVNTIIFCIHVVAYFSWCDEVLLYFIVRVEVVEIQM